MADQNPTIFDQDKLLEMYAALPDNLKEAIFSVNVSEKIMKTGQKYGLNVEQIGKLAETTGFVMLGALHPRSYIQKLEETIGVERTKAIDIAKEINHEVFFPIREVLKKIHHIEDTQEIAGEKEIEKGDALKTISEKNTRQRVPSADVGQVPPPPMYQKPLQPSQPQPPAKQPQQSSPVQPPRSAPTAGTKEKLTQTNIASGATPPSMARRSELPPMSAEPPVVSAIEPRRALFEKFAKPTTPAAQSSTPASAEKKSPGPNSSTPSETRIMKPQTPPAQLKETPSMDAGRIPSLAQQLPQEQRTVFGAKQAEKTGTQPMQHQPQKVPLQEIQTRAEAMPLKIEPKQTQPVQKIPMQEIRPRTILPPEQPSGPGGDKYREPVEGQ